MGPGTVIGYTMRDHWVYKPFMPKMKIFFPPISSLISTLAPSSVPIVRAPFNINFMLPVPDASVPAVEIWHERSHAGTTYANHKIVHYYWEYTPFQQLKRDNFQCIRF